MDYKTYIPNSKLAHYIKCYWTLKAPKESSPERQKIVPDGCMEMIFHFGDLFKQYLDDGNSAIQPRSFVFGQLTQALEIEPTGQTGIFAVRFLPEGFSVFATMAISNMDNRAVPLEELFGADGVYLEKEILNALNIEDKINAIEKFLLDKLITPESIDSIVKSSVETMMLLNGQLSVEELSQNLNVHRRQLERKFASVIGLSPKQLSKIIRLQSVLKLLAKNPTTSLTDAAYEGHYHDQAHFIKDFKEFTGSSPKNFFANNLKMSALFSSSE
jgi:AraC-like DNA-binding protein